MAKRHPLKRVRLVQQAERWQVVDAETGIPLHQGTIEDRALDRYLEMNRMVVVQTKPKEPDHG